MKHIDVLIIDDEKKFADMLAKRIELRGYCSHVCYDGKEALKWLEEISYCVTLILLDLQLPGMYGTEVLSRIKKSNPVIPVVILTGHGTKKDQDKCEQLGAHMFIHKPLYMDMLIEQIENFRESSE